jgi:hypothetical protein
MRISSSRTLFYPQNGEDFDKIMGRKIMAKGRKWTWFGLAGVLLGGIAVLSSFLFKQRKARQRIY